MKIQQLLSCSHFGNKKIGCKFIPVIVNDCVKARWNVLVGVQQGINGVLQSRVHY